MLGIKDLINRYRHNRGYGVQSPYAFHFVTGVLAEKHPYYAYPAINSAAKKCGYNAKRARLLFRSANYAHPQSIIMCAPCEAVACALTMACPSIGASLLVGNDVTQQITTLFEQGETTGLLYVGETPAYASVVEQALGHVSSSSVIIVEGIHRTREKKEWWHSVKQNSAIAVTFDLYSVGVLFFDKSYKKQHYTLKK